MRSRMNYLQPLPERLRFFAILSIYLFLPAPVLMAHAASRFFAIVLVSEEPFILFTP